MADQASRTWAALAAYLARLAINDPYPTFEGKSLVEAMLEEGVLDRLDRLEAERTAADAVVSAARVVVECERHDWLDATVALAVALGVYERAKAPQQPDKPGTESARCIHGNTGYWCRVCNTLVCTLCGVWAEGGWFYCQDHHTGGMAQVRALGGG